MIGGERPPSPQPGGRSRDPERKQRDETVPAHLGDASPFFAGGQNATVSEFPGIVAGIRAGGTRPEGQTCTGTVVAPRKILIAAHCADAQGEKRFVYGLDDLKDHQGGNGSGFAVNVVSYKKHPKYVNFDQGFDVAVVTVDRDIALKSGATYPRFATSADAGTSAITVTGTDASEKTATTTVSLTVEGTGPPAGDVAVTAAPSSASVRQGLLAQTVVKAVVKAAGGTGNLALTASGVPAGARFSFNPATIGQNGSSNVWIFTNLSTPPGTYPITVTATSADGKTGATTFTLTVTRQKTAVRGLWPQQRPQPAHDCRVRP